MRRMQANPIKQLLMVTLFLLLGFLTMLHQFLTWGRFFEMKDLHHETLTLVFFALALGVYVGNAINYTFWFEKFYEHIEQLTHYQTLKFDPRKQPLLLYNKKRTEKGQ